MRITITLLIVFITCPFSLFSQKEVTPQAHKNQVSVNLLYLALGSPNLGFERSLGQNFAFGLAAVRYGEVHKNQGFESRNSLEYVTNHEITPFARLYFNGTQVKSHFLELFVSFNESEEFDKFVRRTNSQGYAVYIRDTITEGNTGLGIGYGYRFLFVENRMFLEAQFGLRTNFDAYLFLPDGAVVRTGIRFGFRF